ncbi:MAG: M6 family metalloprotease domain-containing protein [Chlorobi bacterium]|nr:M6 family metalloprotease domain-containing protein [Chlorobiota bacterium]
MTKEMLVKYKQNGSLDSRIAKAKSFGNYKMPDGSGAYVNYKLKKLKYEADGDTAALMKMQAPPTAWRNMPTKGDVNILVLLVEFQDYPHYTEQAVVENKVLGEGDSAAYPYESLKNYYERASYSQLHFQGNVLGWYSAPYSRSEVVKTTAGRETLIKEIFTYYDEQGVDFSQFDNDGNGSIDYFAIVWTGPHEDWAEFWWGYQTSFSDSSFSVDGVRLAAYSWQWENYNYPDTYDSSLTNIEFSPKTLIHETGHALGLPDYYDYDSSIGPKGGVGGLDMMAASWGDHNCFSKFVLDWLEPSVIINDGEHEVILNPSENDQNVVLVMPDYNETTPYSEFFMVQYRKREGNDTTYPNSGLLIWHVDAVLDANGSNYLYDNSYTEHKLLRLMEADGLEQIETGAYADANDFYVKGSEFTPNTTPNSNAYNGDSTGINITDISDASETISFKVSMHGIMSYLSHYTMSENYWETKLTICNGESEDINIILHIYDNNGVYYGAVEKYISANGGFSSLIPDLFDFSIPEQGYIVMESPTDKVKGVLSVKFLPTNGETSIPLTYQTGTKLLFPLIENIGGKSTGIVILNTTALSNDVTFKLYSYTGALQDKKSYTLNGNQKLVAMLSDIFEDSLIGVGYVKVSTTEKATGFALMFSENNQNIIAIPTDIIN